MRKPTSPWKALRWWREALEGLNPPRHEGIPECGYYSMQDVKGGPYIPVRIDLSRDIDPDTGELTGPEEMTALVGRDEHRDPVQLWTRLRPITEGEYNMLIAANRRSTRVRIDLTKKAARPGKEGGV